MKNVTAIILAAGLGTRMKTDKPKVLHRLMFKPILSHVISGLKGAGIKDIIAVVGYKSEEIKHLFNSEVRFALQKHLLGSGDALKCALGSIKKNVEVVLVTCGDAPLISSATYQGLLRTHIKNKVSCTVLTANLPNPASYGRIIRDKKGRVTGIVEEKDLIEGNKGITEINVGTYCFKRSDVAKYIHDITLNEKKKEFYLTDIVDILVREDKGIASGPCAPDEALGINSRKDLADAVNIMNKRKIKELMDKGVTVFGPDTTFIDETAKIGADTIIFPNTIIEEDVVIGRNCKIGPFARLRAGTRIADEAEIGNFVEVCRTRIGSKTKVKHHTYLGDAVVGRSVNIGAGTITANYDGKKKNRTVIADNAFIGVGAVLIAPVKIGAGAKVGAGSVVTKNKNVPAGETVVGIPARPFKSKGRRKNG